LETLSTRDREILRRRAQIQLDYANSPQNDIILKKWQAQAEGRRDAPPVRLLFSNFRHEVITLRLQCECEQARTIESQLLGTLVGRELFDDELVERQIFINGVDDPVAVFPDRARLIAGEAVGVGIPRGIQPIAAPSLAVVWRREQPVEQQPEHAIEQGYGPSLDGLKFFTSVLKSVVNA